MMFRLSLQTNPSIQDSCCLSNQSSSGASRLWFAFLLQGQIGYYHQLHNIPFYEHYISWWKRHLNRFCAHTPCVLIIGYTSIQNGVVSVGHDIDTIFSANCHLKHSVSCHCETVFFRRSNLLVPEGCFVGESTLLATTCDWLCLCEPLFGEAISCNWGAASQHALAATWNYINWFNGT